ncbi:MAG: P-loop NTPase [Acidimicrobiaceae bacterium]|nr:P-loop NTPase [Acidimicrobiaceae bacterium]
MSPETPVPQPVALSPKPTASAPESSGNKLPGIRDIVAVASGKGGVGKSTVAVNLAIAFSQSGSRVGLVDADILGPSIPGMLGLPVDQPPSATADGRMIPPERYGIKAASMGLLRNDDNPAIMRGPMVSKYLQMLVAQVGWGELDYLILDLPPGTGDTQLTLAQSLRLSGVVIVTTPQDVSLKIARRGLRMFETVNVPIIGIVENMSTFTCPHCNTDTDVFGQGGGKHMSADLGVAFLGSIPLDADIVLGGDGGRPIVIERPESVAAATYRTLAATIDTQLQGLTTAVLGPFLWTWDTNNDAPVWSVVAVRPDGSPPTPVGLAQRDRTTLSVLWEDGRQDDLDVRDLRLACRCAACVEEMSGRALLDPATIAVDVAPRSITSVGNYAINVAWTDGHSTGIYAFDSLRAMAERDDAKTIQDV